MTPPDTGTKLTVDVHMEDLDPTRDLEILRAGITATPRVISSRYLYDDVGSRLFELICALPEYYQTRTERAILEARADEIVRHAGARELVELGSGAATKTRVLLDAMRRQNLMHRYIPFDVNEMIVRRSGEELVELYPGLEVHGVVGDFSEHLEHIPSGDRQLYVFLGGTIGNFSTREATEFLGRVAAVMSPGDRLLLGTDLIKDRAMLHAAYNDSRGVTEAFNLNTLGVVNGLADGDFMPELFDHEAFYNESEHRIEMWVRAKEDHRVRLEGPDVTLDLARGDAIRTEISTKYDRPRVESLLASAGLELVDWFTDEHDLFALSLARPIS